MNTTTRPLPRTLPRVLLPGAAAAAALFTSMAWAPQEGPGAAGGGGVPLRPFATEPLTPDAPLPGGQGAEDEPAAPEPGEAAPADGGAAGVDALADAARLQLADADLDRRMDAYAALAEAARRPGDARAALEKIAADLSEPETAFLARLALREARATAAPGGLNFPMGPGFRGLSGGSLLEELLGADPFAEDLFGGAFPGGRPGGRPIPGGDPFEAARRQMEDAQRQLREQLEALHSRGGAAPAPGPGTRTAPNRARRGGLSIKSVSVQQGPDGVRVRIEEDLGEGTETRTYEGESVEQLLEAHPELRGVLGR
ncbi:MAG: hypothetical protein PVJ89_14215 [Planctomycetota bacterium]